MQQESETAGSKGKRRSNRSNMTGPGMVSLLAAVEVASNNSPTTSDRQTGMTNSSQTPDEPRKGARVFTADERATLETHYGQNKFPTRVMMVEFAAQLSKPPEKVRTWFNNRRALDRKLGVTVVRQPTARQAAPESTGAAEPAVQTASPSPLPHIVHQADNTKITVALGSSQVSVPSTPVASQWPSKITPVTGSRRLSLVTPAPPSSTPRRSPSYGRSHTPHPGSSSRVRLNPARLRKVRLRLGQTELHGEGHPNEVGLEVKFLFGKKRLVYEWYCGDNYSDAAVTGGPYAKIEINFDSLFSMAFERTRDGSVIRMTLSDSPTLFRQTEHNMHKFKVRTQQRQYQKASPDQFDEDVFAKDHQILLRSDEAARVRKTILESVPELACLLHSMQRTHIPPLSDANGFQHDRVTDTESMSAGGRTEPVTPAIRTVEKGKSPPKLDKEEPTGTNESATCTPRVTKIPSEPSSVKSDARASATADQPDSANEVGNAEPEAGKDIPSKPIGSARRTPMTAPSRAHVWETPTRSNVRRTVISVNEHGVGSGSLTTRSATNSHFLFPASPPWQSLGTPFGSDANTVRGASVNYWLSGGPPSVNATPLAGNAGSASTPAAGPLVRRALDFTPGDQKGGRITVTPTVGRKRRFTEVNDENDPSMGNKQARGNPSTPMTRKSVFPPPPMPPPLPPPVPPPLPSQRTGKIKQEAETNGQESVKSKSEAKDKGFVSTTPTPSNGKSGVALPR